MVESGRVPKNGRISVSTEKLYNPGEYGEKVEYVRVPKNCLGESRKRVESVIVPKKGRIRASIENLSQRIPEKAWISVSIEKW